MNQINENQWYKRSVIYELHVRSFCDGNGDGIGDFTGLISKLDYLKDLGVTALWLLPFYPSPLRDDGYDIADYFSINFQYGTLRDFQDFLREAHARELRVITELVINHTSDQHAWFQRARNAPEGSEERNFYVWNESPRRYEDARIIFKDFENSNWAWDAVAKSYYWHRFFSHQPDLNFESPQLQKAIFKVIDFWLEMGVDGMRLDAVPYLYEKEGTICENLPETHAFLKSLRAHVDDRFPGRMLLAEANQWPEDAVTYFGNGDECQMTFHFPLMPRLFMALQMEDRFPIIDIMEQTPPIPSNCQWGIFLRNHDELTLEMVTDEERDYMYQIYAQDPRARINLGIRRRLAPLLGNNRKKMELINSLLFSLPGTPVLYYGDEIGMGDNFYLGDRNGVRTPMQWSADRNAGFSRCNPQQLFLPVIIDPEFHYEAINVDVQQKNISSLYWWMRRLLNIQQRHPVLSEGSIEFLQSENAKILAFLRHSEEETLLIVANLSRFSQAARLDLSKYRGYIPHELFGGNAFPEITDSTTTFTLGPHGFYWLSLEVSSTSGDDNEDCEVQNLNISPEWNQSFKRQLEALIIPDYLRSCRWFGDKHRTFRGIRIAADFVHRNGNADFHILFIEVSFVEGNPVIQILPLAICGNNQIDKESARAVIAKFSNGKLLCDALYVAEFREEIFKIIASAIEWKGGGALLTGKKNSELETSFDLPSRLLGGEQSNTSIVYGEQWVLKFFRRFESDPHAEIEMLRALNDKKFPRVPRYGGEIHSSFGGSEGAIGVLTSYIPNQGDGWDYTVDAIARFFERVLGLSKEELKRTDEAEIIGAIYPERIRQLGVCTAELHNCLSSVMEKEFVPEAFSVFYQRSLYQRMRGSVKRAELELNRKLPHLSATLQTDVREWLSKVPEFIQLYARLLNRKIEASKIRIHGDYHLGQVLNTGNDFVIVDFGGEPRRPSSERLLKHSSLVDVAGMLRSFDYAVHITLEKQNPKDIPVLRPWGEKWLQRVAQDFLKNYFSAMQAPILPAAPADMNLLIHLFLLDKAVYEVGYELSYRPAYLNIPINACLRLLSLLKQ